MEVLLEPDPGRNRRMEWAMEAGKWRVAGETWSGWWTWWSADGNGRGL